MILVDTNIPLRIAQIGHPHPDALKHSPALELPDLLELSKTAVRYFGTIPA
jgi:hypothetical protein